MIPEEKEYSYITGIVSGDIGLYREILLPLAEKPLKKTGAIKYITPEQVLEKCENREWQCWVAHDGMNVEAAFFTYITPYPTGFKTFTIDLVGGENLERWIEQAWGIFKAYAKEHGCGEIIGAGRKGWIKVIGKMDKIEDKTRFGVEV
jgi:hypothetical protein